jgi:flagellar hook-associated protein 2
MSTTSTSTSALSGLLSALNNGSSGLDVTDAVNSIIYADQAPERAWAAQQTTLTNQAAAIQQIESQATSVVTDLQSLSDVIGVFNSVTATSSAPDVLSATAESGTAAGQHTVTVNSLAKTGSWYSAEETSSTSTLPSGSFDITSGGNTTTFTTGSGTDTLTDLAAAINSAGIGVTASVVNDANGARLALVAQTSGSAADFSVSNDTGVQIKQAVVGANASVTVDGVPVSSATNTVTGAITGLTLNLTAASTTPVDVSVSADTSSIESTVTSFVSDYNTLIQSLNSQFTYSATTGAEGVLAADSSVRALQSDVLSAANLNIGSGTLTTLNSLGITTNQDGTLSLDTQTLQSALSTNFEGVVDFFQGDGTTAGYASTFIGTLDSYTDASSGAFTVDINSLNNEYQDLTAQTNTLNTYLATQQTLLTTEYNNANIALQQLPEQIKQVQTLLGEDSSSGSN